MSGWLGLYVGTGGGGGDMDGDLELPVLLPALGEATFTIFAVAVTEVCTGEDCLLFQSLSDTFTVSFQGSFTVSGDLPLPSLERYSLLPTRAGWTLAAVLGDIILPEYGAGLDTGE